MAWFLPIASAVIGGVMSSRANKKQNKANQKAQAAQNDENQRVQALQNAENERVRVAQNAENERVRQAQNTENRRAAEAERKAAEADFAKQRKLAEQDDADKAVRLRAAAEKGGFNPLTLLAAGGLQGSLSPFMSMPSGVSADGFAAAQHTAAGYTANGFTPNKVFDWGPTVVNALNAAIPEISGQAGVARQREQLEQDLLRAQADSLRMPAVGSIVGGGSSGGSGGYSSTGFPPIGSGNTPTLRLNGATFYGDADSSIAEDAEAIAGEAGGLIAGINQIYHMASNYVTGNGGADNILSNWMRENFTIREGSIADFMRNDWNERGMGRHEVVPIDRPAEARPSQFMYPSGSLLRSGLAY